MSHMKRIIWWGFSFSLLEGARPGSMPGLKPVPRPADFGCSLARTPCRVTLPPHVRCVQLSLILFLTLQALRSMQSHASF